MTGSGNINPDIYNHTMNKHNALIGGDETLCFDNKTQWRLQPNMHYRPLVIALFNILNAEDKGKCMMQQGEDRILLIKNLFNFFPTWNYAERSDFTTECICGVTIDEVFHVYYKNDPNQTPHNIGNKCISHWQRNLDMEQRIRNGTGCKYCGRDNKGKRESGKGNDCDNCQGKKTLQKCLKEWGILGKSRVYKKRAMEEKKERERRHHLKCEEKYNIIWPFGKHKEKPLQQIYTEDRQYITNWILSEGFKTSKCVKDGDGGYYINIKDATKKWLYFKNINELNI